MGWQTGSDISWTICKSFAPHSRQITTPVPHRSVITNQMPFLLTNQQRSSTEGCTQNRFLKLKPDLAALYDVWHRHRSGLGLFLDPPSIACVFAPVYKTLLPTTTFLMCTTYLSRRSCPSMHPPKNSKQDISERGHSIKGNTYIICGLFYTKLEMWANAQPDGRPAEYRWRPLLNAAKFG